MARRRVEDEFGELDALKQDARRRAAELGHDLAPFMAYSRTKVTAMCATCHRLAIVNLDPLTRRVYGPAVDAPCDDDPKRDKIGDRTMTVETVPPRSAVKVLVGTPKPGDVGYVAKTGKLVYVEQVTEHALMLRELPDQGDGRRGVPRSYALSPYAEFARALATALSAENRVFLKETFGMPIEDRPKPDAPASPADVATPEAKPAKFTLRAAARLVAVGEPPKGERDAAAWQAVKDGGTTIRAVELAMTRPPFAGRKAAFASAWRTIKRLVAQGTVQEQQD